VGRWSERGCINSAQQYDDLKTWIQERKTAYLAARDNGWLDKCTDHMSLRYRAHSRESCAESALRFKTQKEWFRGDRTAYDAAKRLNIFKECSSHMAENRRSVSKADCISAANLYSSIDDFCKYENFYFKIARENHWLLEIKGIYYERNARAWIEKNLGSADG